jgi:ferredoxin-type protein NapG
MGMTRRDFIAGAVSLAALTAGGEIAWAAEPDDGLVRPLGATDETKFLAGCLRCDRCRSVCPMECIDISHIEDGLASMRAPKMNYHLGYCIFCDKCVDVCPTGVLRSIDPKAEKIGLAEIQQAQCVAWKNPGSCSRCVDVCQYDAVHLDGGVPVVDAAACNGCGQCVYVCPALTLSSNETTTTRGIEVRHVNA